MAQSHNIEPEILPPLRRSSRFNIKDEQLDQFASLLDDIFRLPGTQIRFGLDAIIGLVPGLGDLITGAMSFLIIYAAWQRGLPRVTMTRMLANIGIDTVVGTVPILGDAFDVMWKSNRMNYNLLIRSSQGTKKSHTLQDWLFLILLGLGMLALISLPILLLILVVHLLRR
jgi:hypothetical protein